MPRFASSEVFLWSPRLRHQFWLFVSWTKRPISTLELISNDQDRLDFLIKACTLLIVLISIQNPTWLEVVSSVLKWILNFRMVRNFSNPGHGMLRGGKEKQSVLFVSFVNANWPQYSSLIQLSPDFKFQRSIRERWGRDCQPAVRYLISR